MPTRRPCKCTSRVGRPCPLASSGTFAKPKRAVADRSNSPRRRMCLCAASAATPPGAPRPCDVAAEQQIRIGRHKMTTGACGVAPIPAAGRARLAEIFDGGGHFRNTPKRVHTCGRQLKPVSGYKRRKQTCTNVHGTDGSMYKDGSCDASAGP